jgi:MFS family permease
MGFAFLPIGIGSLVAGPIAGFLLQHFAEVGRQPKMVWIIVSGIGVATTVLLWIYDRVLRPATSEPENRAAASEG